MQLPISSLPLDFRILNLFVKGNKFFPRQNTEA